MCSPAHRAPCGMWQMRSTASTSPVWHTGLEPGLEPQSSRACTSGQQGSNPGLAGLEPQASRARTPG
eukprot:scaffold97602_cov62-Phaeocystis_antarctica.AAC.1